MCVSLSSCRKPKLKKLINVSFMNYRVSSVFWNFSASGYLIYSYFGYVTYIHIVIFWPSTRPKNAIPRWCTGRKWHIPMASNRKRSRGRIKAYNMGQGEGPTVPLQWCTGREWPVNCMTVVSAWWRLNIRFQRSSGRSCGRWIII